MCFFLYVFRALFLRDSLKIIRFSFFRQELQSFFALSLVIFYVCPGLELGGMRVVSSIRTFSDEKGDFSGFSSVLTGEWDCWRCVDLGWSRYVGRLLGSMFVTLGSCRHEGKS